jgi:hypothetical protein
MARCNWCYKEGHNVKTCPAKRQEYRTRAEEEIRSGINHIEGWYQREWAKMTKTWLHDGSSAQDATDRSGYKIISRKQAKCSYCDKTEHNRKTCSVLSRDKGIYIKQVQQARRIAHDWMKGAGFGIGTLVSRGRDWETAAGYVKDLWMITSIEWRLIDHMTMRHNQYSPFNLDRIGNSKDYYSKTVIGFPKIPYDYITVDNMQQLSPDRCQIIATSYSGINPPVGWFDGTDVDLDRIFAERKSSDS